MSFIPSSDQDKTAFGELAVAERTPIVKAAAQYGVGSKMRTITSGTGATAGANTESEFYCSSGTTTSGLGTIFSKDACHYKPGQGLLGEMTARFPVTPVADCRLSVGLLNATDSLGFGYIGTDFGIIRTAYGQQEIYDLTITTFASGAEAASVTIESVVYTVNLTGVGTLVGDAREIADSLSLEAGLALWSFQQIGDGVVIRSLLGQPASGAFSYSSSSSVGNMVQRVAGVTPTVELIAQADWNTSVAAWLDPSKGNVYRVQMQYLGFGDIDFEIEDPETGKFTLVHKIKYANTAVRPSMSQPSYRIGYVAANSGSTTDSAVYGGSVATFIEGKNEHSEAVHAELNFKTGVGLTATNILTLQNRQTFGTKVNLGDILPWALSVSTDQGSKSVIIEVRMNAVVAGVPDFDYHDQLVSIAVQDTAGTTVTGGELITAIILADKSSEVIDLHQWDVHVLPGDSITISGRTTTGTADVLAAVMWKEDL